MEKQEWRQHFLQARRSLSALQRISFSAAIHRQVLNHPAWHRARTIGFYFAFPDEVQTHSLLQSAWKRGKKIAAPVINRWRQNIEFRLLSSIPPWPLPHKQMTRLPIMQPLPAERLDLVLVPGVGFDERGIRLGFGKGYYDRFFKSCRAFRMGLAYESQLTSCLPSREWDVPVDCLITEKRSIVTAPA
ncbi:MAG: 5-formyltetrahydrofolate cyclo-ligase [candidate division FCPU426 bacterium]